MDNSYYSHARPEILALVPETAQRVLDIGCGTGALGAAIIARQAAEVVGIEPCEEAVPVARQQITRIWPDTVEGWLLDPDYDYDCVVCADVLEHLADPEAVLRELHQVLTDDGYLIVSVPNSRNRTVLEQLVRGDYRYTDAGLTDRTHLRLFTRRELQRLLVRCGYEIETLTATLEPGLEQIPPGCAVDHGRLRVACDSQSEAAEFYHYQYLVRAHKAAPAPVHPVSIIIPCWNQVEYTQLCLQSLYRTAPDAQVIVVDNGSTDETAEYLAGISGWDGLQVVSNVENLGWVKAINQGLEVATGESIILLNNDTICPEGWLEPLLRALWTDGVGLAGPLSNNVSGPQQVPTTYRNTQELEGWAWDLMQANRGVLWDCPRLVGFCLAVRREVVAQIGGLDERFGIGMYDDDDICRRAQAENWRTVIAAGSFVHHFGSVSFRALGAEAANALLQHNAQVMRDKWSGGQ